MMNRDEQPGKLKLLRGRGCLLVTVYDFCPSTNVPLFTSHKCPSQCEETCGSKLFPLVYQPMPPHGLEIANNYNYPSRAFIHLYIF
jgi:hypothetical protein